MANWKFGKTQYSFNSTATSGGTLTLVAGSAQFQIFTGSSNHNMKLPDATTTSNGSGIEFTVINSSTGIITVQYADGSTLATVAANTSLDVILTGVGTSNGTWRTAAFAGGSGGGLGSGSLSIKSSNYSIVTGDKGSVIAVDSSGGAVSITLPAPAANFLVTIKDYKGYAGINNITILQNASESIDGVASSVVIATPYYGVTLISDGTNWFKMSDFVGNAPNAAAGRGLFAGGDNGTSSVITYITIATTGNSQAFGNLTTGRYGVVGCSSAVSGVFGGGYNGSYLNTIDYVTIATLGAAASFGTLSVTRYYAGACSSSTRGVFGGGYNGSSSSSTIDYVTIASPGNATSFGSLSVARTIPAACGSSTRGVFGGGDNGSSPQNVIDYITIASTGNATSFGNLTQARTGPSACSNSIRGIWSGGDTSEGGGSYQNTIDYVTIATTANATSFGSLTTSRTRAASCASVLIGVIAGGSPASLSSIEYVNLQTTGNASSFGNLLTGQGSQGACSNSHGGLY